MGSKVAAPRICEYSVFDAVERIAGVINSVSNQWNFAARNVSVALQSERDPQVAADIVTGPVISRITGDDAVEIFWVTLRFDQGFVAALRASVEVRMRRQCAIEGPHDGFVGFRHDVNGTIARSSTSRS